MKLVSRISCLINSIAAINWGIVAFKGLEYNFVTLIHNLFGVPYVDQVLYLIIAISGIYAFIISLMPGCGTMCE